MFPLEGIAEKASVNSAFHLAVLEASLEILAKRLAEIPVTAKTDDFHASEAPLALEEARQALAALKQADLAMQGEAG